MQARGPLPARGRLSTMLLLVATSTALPSGESSMPRSDRQAASPVASSLRLQQRSTAAQPASVQTGVGSSVSATPHAGGRVLKSWRKCHHKQQSISSSGHMLVLLSMLPRLLTNQPACVSTSAVAARQAGPHGIPILPVGARCCILLLHHAHHPLQQRLGRICTSQHEQHNTAQHSIA